MRASWKQKFAEQEVAEQNEWAYLLVSVFNNPVDLKFMADAVDDEYQMANWQILVGHLCAAMVSSL